MEMNGIEIPAGNSKDEIKLRDKAIKNFYASCTGEYSNLFCGILCNHETSKKHCHIQWEIGDPFLGKDIVLAQYRCPRYPFALVLHGIVK